MNGFGFSWVGAAFLVALFTPNIIWAVAARPTGYDPAPEDTVLQAIERVGQVLTVVTALVFDATNVHPWTPWSSWLVAAIGLMVLYEVGWMRYFRSPRTMNDFYRPLLGIPVPLAVLPAVAFLFLGVYGRLLPLICASVVLGIGHVGIHLAHERALRRREG